MFSSLVFLLFFTFFTLISVLGFGRCIITFLHLKNEITEGFISIQFIFGLIIIGFLAICINFFINIDDLISVLFIITGSLIYFFINLKKNSYTKELQLIFLLILIAVFFSFYSLLNDDFDYHLKTIVNFKENPISINNLQYLSDGSRIMFNSHWLLLNSVFYFSQYPSSVFSLTALLYVLIIYDFFSYSIEENSKINFLPSLYSFFVLVFLLGVMNSFKEYGTDFPGQIILFLIFLIFFIKYEDLLKRNDHLTYLILLSLSFFIISIKLSNFLILFLIIIIFFKLKTHIKIIFYSLIFSIPLLLWILQNYFISDCLFWPIAITCFENQEYAEQTYFLIHAFSKSLDSSTNPLIIGLSNSEILILLENYGWITIWFKSHFHKIVDTYGFYSFLFIFFFLISFFYKADEEYLIKNFQINKLLVLKFSNPYFIFIIVSLISTLIWFLQSPAYRFGIAYNLNFIIIFLIPLWKNILLNKKNFFKHSSRILIFISILFFTYNNIFKINLYTNRHNMEWPNIIDGKYIN